MRGGNKKLPSEAVWRRRQLHHERCGVQVSVQNRLDVIVYFCDDDRIEDHYNVSLTKCHFNATMLQDSKENFARRI